MDSLHPLLYGVRAQMIPFNKPYMTGRELHYIAQAHTNGHLQCFRQKAGDSVMERTRIGLLRISFRYLGYGFSLLVLLFVLLFPSITQAGVFKVGSFIKRSGTGTQSVPHGLGITPKAIIFWTNSKTNESFSGSFQFAFGVTDGTTSRSSSAASQDGQNDSNASRRIANAAITIVQWGETLTAEAQWSSWDATNFTLNWTTNNATGYVIHFIAIGGNDISAKVVGWTMPTATGNFSVTGVGFRPDVIINAHVGSGYTSAVGTSQDNAGVSFGTMDFDGDQWSSEIFIVDNAGTSDTQRSQRTSGAFQAINNGLAITKAASWVSMDANGFTMNFTTANGNAAQTYSLCLKGVNVKVGNFNKSTAAAPASQSVTGVGFRPNVILLSSFLDVAQANPVVNGRYGIGASDGTTEGSSTFQDTDGSNNTSVDGIDKTSKVFMKVDNNTPTINAEADTTSLDADGFTLNWTTNDGVGTQILYLALGTLAPTAVQLTSFDAVQYAGTNKVLLRWRTSREIQNLGFDLYRETKGRKIRINRSPIAGTALLVGSNSTETGWSYQWWDDLTDDHAPQYWLEDIDLNGKRTVQGPIIPRVQYEAPTGRDQAQMLNSLGGQKSESSPLRVIDSSAVLEKNSAKKGSLKKQWDLAAHSTVKFGIQSDGWYRITQKEMLAAGMDPDLDPRDLRLFKNGRQIRMGVFGEKDGQFDPTDYIEFYANGFDNPFTKEQVYWLESGSQRGKRIRTHDGSKSNLAPPASFLRTVERKDRVLYFAALNNGDAENFFGPVVGTDPVDQTLNIHNLDSSPPGNANLLVSLQGVTDLPDQEPDHAVNVLVNGNNVGQISFDGQTLQQQEFSIPQNWLNEGQNTVSLTAVGGDQDVSVIDFVRLTYWHTFKADSDLLEFSAEGKQQITIDGFTTSNIRIVDITKPEAVIEIPGTIQPEPNGFSITANLSMSGSRNFLAFGEGRVLSPATIKPNQPSTWNSKENRADIVILTHRDFFQNFLPLQTFRESQGHATALIDVEDIYDEFSYGSKNPQAIKDFLLLANSNWQESPRFLVLGGDASLDPKNYLQFGNFDFVPTKLITTELFRKLRPTIGS